MPPEWEGSGQPARHTAVRQCRALQCRQLLLSNRALELRRLPLAIHGASDTPCPAETRPPIPNHPATLDGSDRVWSSDTARTERPFRCSSVNPRRGSTSSGLKRPVRIDHRKSLCPGVATSRALRPRVGSSVRLSITSAGLPESGSSVRVASRAAVIHQRRVPLARGRQVGRTVANQRRWRRHRSSSPNGSPGEG